MHDTSHSNSSIHRNRHITGMETLLIQFNYPAGVPIIHLLLIPKASEKKKEREREREREREK